MIATILIAIAIGCSAVSQQEDSRREYGWSQNLFEVQQATTLHSTWSAIHLQGVRDYVDSIHTAHSGTEGIAHVPITTADLTAATDNIMVASAEPTPVVQRQGEVGESLDGVVQGGVRPGVEGQQLLPSNGETPPRLAQVAVSKYNVEQFLDTLWYVEWCESRHQYETCKVGDLGELGPFQFLPSTWDGMPFKELDPCNRAVAWEAAAWFVSVGRQYEFSCWPR